MAETVTLSRKVMEISAIGFGIGLFALLINHLDNKQEERIFRESQLNPTPIEISADILGVAYNQIQTQAYNLDRPRSHYQFYGNHILN